MSDITIFRRHTRALVFSTSEAGKQWIKKNITEYNHPHDPSFTINIDYLEDLVENIRKDYIEVEVV